MTTRVAVQRGSDQSVVLDDDQFALVFLEGVMQLLDLFSAHPLLKLAFYFAHNMSRGFLNGPAAGAEADDGCPAILGVGDDIYEPCVRHFPEGFLYRLPTDANVFGNANGPPHAV